MDKKKILFTIVNGHKFGGQAVCMDYMKVAKEMEFIPILLSQTEGGFVDEVRKYGIQVYIRPMKRMFHIHSIPSILNVLRKEKIDLIHTNDTVSGNVLMRIAAKILNIPIMSHIHVENNFGNSRFKAMIAKLLDNITSRFCIRIIAVSNHTKKQLISQGYDKNKISVIHNAIDINKTLKINRKEEYRREFKITQDAKIIIHIGRFCESKGQIDLIESMKSVIEDDRNIYCFMIGGDIYSGGRFKEELIKMIYRYELDKNIRLLEYRNDIDNLLDYSDILVLPSYMEGLPIVILEAMMHKKPVVAYKVSGVQEEIEDGVNGYLVDNGDIKMLGARIKKLLQNSETRRRMGEAGYKILKERFDYAKYRKNIKNLYEEVFNMK